MSASKMNQEEAAAALNIALIPEKKSVRKKKIKKKSLSKRRRNL